jgi:hypothetical protein
VRLHDARLQIRRRAHHGHADHVREDAQRGAFVGDAVLRADDGHRRWSNAAQGGQCRHRVLRLDRQHDHGVRRPGELGRAAQHRKRERRCSTGALEAQPTIAQGLEVRARATAVTSAPTCSSRQLHPLRSQGNQRPYRKASRRRDAGEYQTSPLFSDEERAALDFASELTEDKHVNPETSATLSRDSLAFCAPVPERPSSAGCSRLTGRGPHSQTSRMPATRGTRHVGSSSCAPLGSSLRSRSP